MVALWDAVLLRRFGISISFIFLHQGMTPLLFTLIRNIRNILSKSVQLALFQFSPLKQKVKWGKKKREWNSGLCQCGSRGGDTPCNTVSEELNLYTQHDQTSCVFITLPCFGLVRIQIFGWCWFVAGMLKWYFLALSCSQTKIRLVKFTRVELPKAQWTGNSVSKAVNTNCRSQHGEETNYSPQISKLYCFFYLFYQTLYCHEYMLMFSLTHARAHTHTAAKQLPFSLLLVLFNSAVVKQQYSKTWFSK